jgi:hypothetical protein
MRGSRSALLLYSALLFENFSGSHPQVWSITLLLPSGSFPLRLQKYNLFLKRTRKKPENLQKVSGCENNGGKKHLNEVN